MKKLRSAFLVLAVFATLALAACDTFVEMSIDDNQFWGFDFAISRARGVHAYRIAENDYVVIYLERGQEHLVSRADAQAMADEFAGPIRSTILRYFAPASVSIDLNGTTTEFRDILHFANHVAGGNAEGRTTILLYDIRSGGMGGAFVAGFFFAMDMMQRGPIPNSRLRANGRDILHINTFLFAHQSDGLKSANLTIIHELAHLVNFAQSLNMWFAAGASSQTPLRLLDVWIDEALAMQAEQIYLGDYLEDRIAWFVNDRDGTIARGNNFFVWGNHHGRAVLDDYSTAYLFLRWLFLHAQATPGFDIDSIFYRIITSPYENYRAVTSVARDIRPEWESWEVLLGTWHAANFFPQNPDFGYRGHLRTRLGSGVRAIHDLPFISLYPGEGVFSPIAGGSFTPPEQTGYIRYVGLTPTGRFYLGASPTITGNTLLTFNASTTINNRLETGFLTNVAQAPSPESAEMPVALLPEPEFYAVGAWTLYRGNKGIEVPSGFALPFRSRNESERR